MSFTGQSVEDRLKGRIEEYTTRLQATKRQYVVEINTLASEIVELQQERIKELEARVERLQQRVVELSREVAPSSE